MNESDNGHPLDPENPQELPHLVVTWNQDTQQADIAFDPKVWKAWDFVIAVLDMAKAKAEMHKKMSMVQQMKAAEAHAKADQQIRQQIFKGR